MNLSVTSLGFLFCGGLFSVGNRSVDSLLFDGAVAESDDGSIFGSL